MLDIYEIIIHAHLSSLVHWSVLLLVWQLDLYSTDDQCPSLKASYITQTSYFILLLFILFHQDFFTAPAS